MVDEALNAYLEASLGLRALAGASKENPPDSLGPVQKNLKKREHYYFVGSGGGGGGGGGYGITLREDRKLSLRFVLALLPSSSPSKLFRVPAVSDAAHIHP